MAGLRKTSETPMHYVIALGSNQRHHLHGAPTQVLAAALAVLNDAGLRIVVRSETIGSAPLGPSRRRYANCVVLLETALSPLELLARLQQVERAFGRRRSGQRWRARVLDLDIVLWNGGAWSTPELTIPHHLFRQRAFVAAPLKRLVPQWRDPITGLTMRQLHARLTRPRPLPR